MTKANKKGFIIFSVVYYVVAFILLAIGTFSDLEIDKALFNPQAKFPIYMEAFGQFVYWGLWGPAFSVLFVNIHDLNECLDIIGKLFPFVKRIENTQSKCYKIFNIVLKIFEGAAFFVLADIGWKKLIENILNKFFDIPQLVYFIICAVISAISVFLFSKIDKKTLSRLESVALAGIAMGFTYKMVENCKSITGRIRFREMVAWSNGVTQIDDGQLQSLGELDGLTSHLKKDMVGKTDFSAFTKWYTKAEKYGYYDHANSFPSGHTTYSCTGLISVFFCKAIDKLKKYMPVAFLLSFAYIAIMAFSRLITGAHYMTDVAGAAIIGYTLFIIVNFLYNFLTRKDILPTRK